MNYSDNNNVYQRQTGSQRRVSFAQFAVSTAVLMVACGVAFSAVANDVELESNEGRADTRIAGISSFCIFGVDDVKIRPSAGRLKGEEIKPVVLENGDCWIDKPGQTA